MDLEQNTGEPLTYETSLELLGTTENDSFATIHNQHKLFVNNLIGLQGGVGSFNTKIKYLVPRLNEAFDLIQVHRLAFGSPQEKKDIKAFCLQQAQLIL